jgi:hypothetical protein
LNYGFAPSKFAVYIHDSAFALFCMIDKLNYCVGGREKHKRKRGKIKNIFGSSHTLLMFIIIINKNYFFVVQFVNLF